MILDTGKKMGISIADVSPGASGLVIEREAADAIDMEAFGLMNVVGVVGRVGCL